ncbi:UvrD-helicase domain-containing protein [Rickettsiales bacterium LUAb2]
MTLNNLLIDPNIQQKKASNPKHSVWVSASAGSGKTKVLIDRILRILLSGTSPSEILCITYSKTATNVIKNRIILALSNWATMPEEELIINLQNLLDQKELTEKTIITAKSLCNTVLDSLTGIKVQTIHSFCQNLISNVRLETDLLNSFSLLDENSQLMVNIMDKVLTNTFKLILEDDNFSKEVLLYYFNEDKIYDLLKSIINYEKQLTQLAKQYGENNNLKKAIYKIFNADISFTAQEFIINNSQDTNFNYNGFKELLEIFINNDITTHKKVNIKQILCNWLNSSPEQRNFSEWSSWFLKDGYELKTSIIPVEIKKLLPNNLSNLLAEEAIRLQNLTTKVNNIINAEFNFEFLKIAIKIINEYKQQKLNNQVFDYNQLLNEARNLLDKPDILAWVAYKLDQKISHILIDESQDTSPQQWEIIKQIVAELFNNHNDTNQSLFVVGDIKQSIFSFQGANPQTSKDTKNYLQNILTTNNYNFINANLNMSFRSAPSIINTVNSLIYNIFDSNSNIYHDENLEHYCFKANTASLVEIWPLVVLDETTSKNNSSLTNKTYHYFLAKAITTKIKHLIAVEKYQPKDIMILFRKRENNKTINYIISMLTNDGVPVSGLDKLNLTKHIAILDIISIAKFMAQPLDNLNLASLLKSPVFNFTDDILADIINHNKELALWEALQINTTINIINTVNLLKKWLNLANTVSLFDLFINIFYKDNLLNKLTDIFGVEINSFIDEFINFILEFEQDKSQSTLQHFIYLLENINPKVKREQDPNDNTIKFMTIHGSKGLEAKIIFLVDNIGGNNQIDTLIASKLHSDFIFIKSNKASNSQLINQELEHIKSENFEELKRLLYVAITRSEERLYICAGSNKIPKEDNLNSIYQVIINSISPSTFKEVPSDFFSSDNGFCNNKLLYMENSIAKELLTILPITVNNDLLLQQINSSTALNINHELPDFLTSTNSKNHNTDNHQLISTTKQNITKSQKQASIPNQLSFSELLEINTKITLENSNIDTPKKANTQNIKLENLDNTTSSIKNIANNGNSSFTIIGTVIHKIIEYLSFIPKSEQNNFITYTLQNELKFLENEEQLKISKRLINLINDPKYNFIFNSNNNTLSEAAIAGSLGDKQISSRIDKLIITEQEVFIIDYKFAKSSNSNINSYSAQINHYKTLLQSIYPNKNISGYLLFLNSQDLIKI